MKKKNIFIVLAVVCVLSTGIFAILHTNKSEDVNIQSDKPVPSNKKTEQSTKNTSIIKNNGVNIAKFDKKNQSIDEHHNNVKKANLYSESSSSAIPLSAISEIADLSPNIQNVVAKIASDKNIYMIQKSHNNLLIISDNPANIRHSIEFTEVSLDNGHQVNTTLGYNDKINDSDNDIWEYNPETHQPERHTKYNKNGDVEFVEMWSYAPKEQVKYEMKSSDNKVISMRKETLENGMDLRIEHLVYDKDGNTKMNVSVTYDGEDIKRFTYYNADKPDVSGSIFSDYSDGLKIKETVYTSDLKPKEIYTSTYKDGAREDIIKWDNQNREVQKLIQEE